jgi:hypothetical protein
MGATTCRSTLMRVWSSGFTFNDIAKCHSCAECATRYQSLAASVEPILDGCLAWVGVYPLDLNRETTREFLRNQGQAVPLSSVHVYHLRRFEVERSLIEQDVWIAEPDLKNKTSMLAYGDDDLMLKLKHQGVLLEELVLPDRSNCPI